MSRVKYKETTVEVSTKRKLPAPSKPLLPPPPPPPLSLMFLENPYTLLPTSIDFNTEQLLYNEFLQNHVLKYKNPDRHKTCEVISARSLQYFNSDYISESNSSYSPFSPASLKLKNNSTRIFKIKKVNANSHSRSTTIANGVATATKHNTTRLFTYLNIASSTSTTWLTLNSEPDKKTSRVLSSHSSSPATAATSITHLNANAYLKNVLDSLYSNPLQFFIETLLIPLVFMLMFLSIVFIGVLFKR